MLRFAANRGALLLVVRACFDLTKQMLRETTREGKKRGSVSSSGAPAKRPHAKRALAENGDLRGHEELGLHIRSPKKLIFAVDTHMEMTRFLRRFDWRAQFFRATPRCGDPLSPQLAYSDPPRSPFISVRSCRPRLSSSQDSRVRHSAEPRSKRWAHLAARRLDVAPLPAHQ